MSILTLYHGSANIIETPEFGKGKMNNDYGQGFYCTKHLELAKEWACVTEDNGYANRYEIETKGLAILNLQEEQYSILNWLAILLNNRKMRLSSPVEKRGAAYLIDNFLPDTEKKDIIIGYRADDSYFMFARTFLANTITLDRLAVAMKLGKLGEQYMIKSKKAFKRLRFTGYEIADGNIYYPKRKARDEAARKAFQKMSEEDSKGLFLNDIIKKGKKGNGFTI